MTNDYTKLIDGARDFILTPKEFEEKLDELQRSIEYQLTSCKQKTDKPKFMSTIFWKEFIIIMLLALLLAVGIAVISLFWDCVCQSLNPSCTFEEKLFELPFMSQHKNWDSGTSSPIEAFFKGTLIYSIPFVCLVLIVAVFYIIFLTIYNVLCYQKKISTWKKKEKEFNHRRTQKENELRTFEVDKRESIQKYSSEFYQKCKNAEAYFISRLAKQEFGIVSWAAGEIIYFLENVKHEMEDNSYIRRVSISSTLCVKLGSGIDLEISNSLYTTNKNNKHYDYFSSGETVLPSNKRYEIEGYCNAIVHLVTLNMRKWLSDYDLQGDFYSHDDTETIGNGKFSIIYDSSLH